MVKQQRLWQQHELQRLEGKPVPFDLNGKALRINQMVRLLCVPNDKHQQRCLEKTGVVVAFTDNAQGALVHFANEKDLVVPTYYLIGLKRKKHGQISNA